ncbi:MAG TPA: Mrp/NBP35 family ATP-binding protein [Verrucomicrobiales bacterium]|nr:Mrp/NBP35 family ATP-binding protein [Verrucomicrobiales bacterium]
MARELTEEQVREALKGVRYPGFSRDIVSFGLVKEVVVEEGRDVRVRISVATRDPQTPQQLYRDCREALQGLEGVGKIDLDFDIREPEQTGAAAGGTTLQLAIPGVRSVVAVASGKGGVGKSTVAVNLAVALRREGLRVGLCDCDLYGPSVAHMSGSRERPGATEDNRIIPIVRHGLQLISMGFLVEDSSPVIVRGPMATRYTQQFLRQVVWDDLDMLLLDLPPGTGDIQLTIVQTVALDGAVIVTTPQEVALIDARKAVAMFEKVNVRVLGIVENMSYFQCPSDGKRYFLFGEKGGAREAQRLGVPLLGEVPLEMETRERSDAGEPVALDDPQRSGMSAVFRNIAAQVRSAVGI